MQQQDQGSLFGLDDARAFIAKAKWTYASSVPQHPHAYSLRRWLTPELQVDFDAFAAMIARDGYGGEFWNASWLYLGYRRVQVLGVPRAVR